MLDSTLRCAALAAAAALAFAAPSTAQNIELGSVFGDHMVLQRGRPIPLWGQGRPGDPIEVKLGDQTARGVVESAGFWRIDLPAREAGGPFELRVKSTNEVVVRDVLIGEVWVCSGQSNMEWPVEQSDDAESEIATADFPQIRLLHVERASSDQPVEAVQGSWQVCAPTTIPDFSAVGYYFGRKLQHDLGVPIGLIESAWGGTPAEAWTSPATLAGDPEFQPIVRRWNDGMRQWAEASAQVKEGGQKPRAPNPGNRPSGLYHAMVEPLVRFPIRGVIWYQGESNASRAYQYRTLFPAMIKDWREAWGHGDFPFLFVQLANFKVNNPETWAELREAQRLALSQPNTGMAVTIDIGNPKDIHPRNKQDVGERLALWALAKTYDREVVYSGPLVRGAQSEQGAVRVRFEHVGGGLAARGGGELRGFEIATAEGPFYPAEARIDGDAVIVSSGEVPAPVQVRYSWTDDPDGNLMNVEGLPASPFRTDERQWITRDAR